MSEADNSNMTACVHGRIQFNCIRCAQEKVRKQDATLAQLREENYELEKRLKQAEWSRDTEINARINLTDECADLRSRLAAAEKEVERLKETAMGRGMVSEMADMAEVAVLVCGLHDRIKQLEYENKTFKECVS